MVDPIIIDKGYIERCLDEASHAADINEDEWNIDKWRNETPMDYLKAVALIVGSENSDKRNTIFNTIYKLSRLYIPDQLVKYYSLTDNIDLNNRKFDTLRNQKVYLSSSKEFNDPFDNKAFFYRPEALMAFKELEKIDGKFIDDFSEYTIGCSFSDIGVNSRTMWGIYSNSNQGYCVSYNTSQDGPNSEIRTFAFPIQYVQQRVDITEIMYRQVKYMLDEKERQIALGQKAIILDDLTLVFIITLLFYIKSCEWEREKEFRVSVGTKDKKYVKAIPSALYIGLNCSKVNEAKLLQIGNDINIPIYKMKYNDTSADYKLCYYRL